MNMVSCACPPLHLHTSRVDLVLCYNLYLTTVLSSCFFSILLLSHLGSAGIRGACLTSAFISPGRTHFTVSCHLIFSLPGSQSLAQALCCAEPAMRGSVCCSKLQVPISATPAPVLLVQLSSAIVRGQAEPGAEAEFVKALLPLQPALGCSSTAEGS